MTIEKRSDNSYRIRQMYKGKLYVVKLDHKPTQKEATILLAEKMESDSDAPKGPQNTFKSCALNYIKERSNVLSKSTLRSYGSILRALSDEFVLKNIYDIEQTDIQSEINAYSAEHSPKSVRNLHGFISAVLGDFRPNMTVNSSLPLYVPKKAYRASEEDIKQILEASKDKPMYHICFQLGVLGLRRSEVCALQIEDLKGLELSIHRTMVETSGTKGQKWVIQERTKTDKSTRTIQIGQSLADEINELGYICNVVPSQLVKNLHAYQKKLGINEFRFHDLRHYFASYAHAKGIPDVYIMQMGGWSSTYTMNKIYKEAMEKESEEMQTKIANLILS